MNSRTSDNSERGRRLDEIVTAYLKEVERGHAPDRQEWLARSNEDDVRRFRAEAEAAAKLEHAGIVPVFEVGKFEGHHYFTLAFVDGKRLASSCNG